MLKKGNRVEVETFHISSVSEVYVNKSTAVQSNQRLKFIIYFVAIIIHSTSIFYLLLFCAFALFADWVTLTLMKIYEPKLFGVCYFCCLLLHLFGLVKVICGCCCCNSKIRKSHEKSLSKKIERDNWFEEKLIVAECLEIPAATYQAWSLSNSTSSVLLTLFLPFVICLNCYVTPLTLRSRNPMIRRYGTLFIDVSFDFLVGVFFQLLVIFPPLFEFYYIGNIHIANNIKWYTTTVLMGRFICVSSLIDLATKIFPFLLNFVSLHTLICYVEETPGFEVKRKTLDNENKERRENFARKFLSYVSFVWGTMILIVAVFAMPRGDCHPACLVNVYSWLDSSCNCMAVDFNCRRQNLTNKELHKQLDSLSHDLRSVRISQCVLTDGVRVKSLSRFNQLFYLSVGYSNIRHWKSEGYKLPDSVATLYIIETDLQEVPSFLAYSPPSQLIELIIQGSNIKYLPNSISKSWKRIGYLTIDYSNFTEFPKPLLDLGQLLTLSLAYNSIKQIPPNLPMQLSNVGVLLMSGNPIADLPLTFNNTLPLLSTFEVSNSPLCERIIKSNHSSLISSDAFIFDRRKEVCKSECSSTCIAYQVNNYICTKACNTEACKWDGGDCDYILP